MLENPTTIRLKCARLCEKLYLNGNVADVHFIFDLEGETKKIPAHKNILANGSPVFMTMFYGTLKEEGDVKIVDASCYAFEIFLQFFYLAEVSLNIEHIAEVIKMLDKYNVPDGIKICDEFLKQTLTAHNIVFGVELALNFHIDDLKIVCSEKICNNPAEVFVSNSFLECSKEALVFILKLDQLKCKESSVFKACMEWARHSCKRNVMDAASMQNIRNQLSDCFNLIQFGVMDPEEIFECVKDNDQLFERDELQELFAIADPQCFANLKIFKHVTRENVKFNWNKTKAIRCSRSNDDPVEYYLKKDEIVQFRSNRRILFGGISMKRLWRYNYSSSECSLTCKMKIVEKAPSPTIGDVTKLTKTFTIKTNKTSRSHNYIEFGPLPIKPNRLYHLLLHLELPSDRSFVTSGSNKDSNFVGGCSSQIIFDHYESQCDGLVSDLYFNII